MEVKTIENRSLEDFKNIGYQIQAHILNGY